jgi:hypothetical protein
VTRKAAVIRSLAMAGQRSINAAMLSCMARGQLSVTSRDSFAPPRAIAPGPKQKRPPGMSLPHSSARARLSSSRPPCFQHRLEDSQGPEPPKVRTPRPVSVFPAFHHPSYEQNELLQIVYEQSGRRLLFLAL